jgi:heptosyltransferase-2
MKKFLIIGPAWVGDMVMSQSLYRLIKSIHPGAWITVLAPTYTLPLLNAMPEVDEAIAGDFPRKKLSFFRRFMFGRELSKKGFTDAIVLPNSWKSALVPFFARIPNRTGFIGECRYGLLNDIRRLQAKKWPRMIDRFCVLGVSKKSNSLPLYPSPQLLLSSDAVANTIQKFNVNRDKPILALCPGAEFGPAKQWPARYFAELALAQAKEGWAVWIFGSKKDEKISAEIENILAAGHVTARNFSGKTSLEEAMALLSISNQVVSNDSGLMHIASALHRPVLAIYGSTSPGFTPPLFSGAKIVKLDLPCQPCFKRVCPFKKDDPRYMSCLNGLTPQQVESHLMGN